MLQSVCVREPRGGACVAGALSIEKPSVRAGDSAILMRAWPVRRPALAGQARPTENTQPPHSISPRGLPTNAAPTIRALSTIGPSPPSYLSLLPSLPPPTSAHPRLRRHTHPAARPRSAAEARAALMSPSSDGVASDICRQPSRVVLRRGGPPRHQYFIS